MEKNEMDKLSGANLLGILNDLKRRPEDAARELGVDLDLIKSIIAGEEILTDDLVVLMCKLWPVNKSDFYMIKDDTSAGLKIMRSEWSEKSSRVMTRAGKPYYEYRDTAMSTVGQFRPEWILELCEVEDNNPENPNVQWNNGHFMHQFTYFIGPVNFYYKGKNGEKCVAIMNTGDTMYITPFVPHTFTTRKNQKGEKGLILALTYGNKLSGETQKELSALGSNISSQYVLDFSSREKTFSSLLNFHRLSANLSIEELAKRTNFTKEEILNFEKGNFVPEFSIIKILAVALSINSLDLLPYDQREDKVVIDYNNNSNKTWFYPETTKAYKIAELSSTSSLPYSKSLEFTINSIGGINNFELDLRCGLHQYGFNVGSSTIQVNWRFKGKDNSATLSPGDSFYMKPFIEHNFRGQGKLLILRIGGRIAGDAMREISLIGKENAERLISETMQWFNVEGRRDV